VRPEVVLTVGGKRFTGWESVDLYRSMEALCGSFRLRVSDRSVEQRGEWPIPEGASCEVSVGGVLWLSGYVDVLQVFYEPGLHSVQVEGRDLAEDLVDCVPADLPAEYFDVDVLELARRYAEPFDVEVLAQEGLDLGAPFARFGLRPGETAHEAIERACRLRGMLALSSGSGAVVLTRGGGRRASVRLVQGKNVAGAQQRIDRSGRYSRYYVRGQQPGSDLAWGPACNELEGIAHDPVPRPQRTLVLVAEGPVDDEVALERATWEANSRAARGSTLEVTTHSWLEGFDRGPLWEPNTFVRVDVPRARASGDWLVSAVRLSLDPRQGTVAQLSLTRPDAWVPEPPRFQDEPTFGEDLEE